MLGVGHTFLTICREEGIGNGLLAAGEYPAPPSVAARFALMRTFRNQATPGIIPRRTRLALWRRGFTPRSYCLYDFETNDMDAYLSDLAEERCWAINEPYTDSLDDKRTFYDLLERTGFDRVLPTEVGVIEEGRLRSTDVNLARILDREGTVVVKPRAGAAGNDINICSTEGTHYTVNDRGYAPAELDAWLDRLDDHLVTEYCQQADYIDRIFPHTPTSIRPVSMNPRDADPFVARAVHRIGTHASKPVDNFSRGGLSAPIDANGVMGQAVRYRAGTATWYDDHPDTGVRITGTAIPGWETIRATILEIVHAIPALRYVGWDVIVTDGGCRIIEGNANTDTDLLQAHGPLLADDRVSAIYREHGVVP